MSLLEASSLYRIRASRARLPGLAGEGDRRDVYGAALTQFTAADLSVRLYLTASSIGEGQFEGIRQLRNRSVVEHRGHVLPRPLVKDRLREAASLEHRLVLGLTAGSGLEA